MSTHLGGAPHAGLRLASEVQLSDLMPGLNPDVLINSASTGVSVWDGIIPDPVDPAEFEQRST